MERKKLIQTLIERRRFNTYLEIGVLGGYVFFDIRCKNKIAVDPEFRFNWKGRLGQMFRNVTNISARFFEVSSDIFFERYASKVLRKGSLDIVLIDGMHEFKYVLNDVVNSLEYLSDRGVIVLHDCNPLTEDAACSFEQWKERGYAGNWNGDVWKCIVYLIATRSDIDIFVANCDHGLGIITKSKRPNLNTEYSSLSKVNELTYADFDRNRDDLINLKPLSYLEEWISRIQA